LSPGEFTFMGVASEEGKKVTIEAFKTSVILFQLKVVFAYIILGFFLGTITYSLWATLPFRLGKEKNPSFFKVLLSLIIFHLYLLALSIQKYPALYTTYFYDRGDFFRSLQVFITHSIDRNILLIPTYFIIFLLLCFLIKFFYQSFHFRQKPHNFLKRLKSPSLIGGISLLAVISIFGYLRSTAGKPDNQGPNVLILAADSLRADRLGNQGYPRNLTPNIDTLSASGVNFLSCFTSLPRTFPAWISIFNSKYPNEHGVRHMFPEKRLRDHRAGSILTALKGKGYRTAVVADYAGDVFSRMRNGFDTVIAPYFNIKTIIRQRGMEIHYHLFPYITNHWGRVIFPILKEFANLSDPSLLTDELKGTISRLKNEEKFFILAFYSVTHFPYAAPYPYYRKYTGPDYRGQFKYHKPNLIYTDSSLNQDDINHIQALYDGTVNSFDDAAGEVLNHLKKEGLQDNTIIIITADHGENLYEEGRDMGHGEHFRGDNVLRMPLVIHNPGLHYPASKITSIVRDIDISPTLMEILGFEPLPNWQGKSLLPLMEGKMDDLHLLAFAETGIWFSNTGNAFYQSQRLLYPDILGLGEIDNLYNDEVVIREEYRELINIAKHRMVRSRDAKLIYIPTRKGVTYEFYDLVNDPEQTVNIASRYPEKADELKRLLQQWMSREKGVTWANEFLIPSYSAPPPGS
ncbi:MAG: sulfatase-like hydrolase/transferase, partial [Deltaproteobacteria bacterium]